MIAPPATNALQDAPPRPCENCGTPLHGPYCGACGQPVKGMVRHFSTVIGDLLDTVFDFDSRIARTLGPLLLRPGHITREYFHGHRVPYVSPVRLFFVLCILAFLVMRFTVDTQDASNVSGSIEQAETIQEVERLRDVALTSLQAAREAISDLPDAAADIDRDIARITERAQYRIDWLTARQQAQARGEQFDLSSAGTRERRVAPPPEFRFNEDPWHESENPVAIAWLPERINTALNRAIGRAQTNLAEVRHDRSRLIDAFFRTLPQTLFVLVPLFALVLKLAYAFTPRLYMEHLIVALHSHAFLCAMLVLLAATSMLRDLLQPGGLAHDLFDWVFAAQLLWMPIYLLLMQKRVYGQGWLLTGVKFLLLSHIHFALVIAGLLVSLAVSLVAM